MPAPAPALPGRRHRLAAGLAVLLALAAGFAVIATGRADAAGTLLSQGRPTTSSSTENATLTPAAATDGNPGTRWSSAFSDPQWLQVDLAAPATIDQVTLVWEAAYARAFQIQVSADAANWTTVFSTTTGAGGSQTVTVAGSGRYVRMYGTQRGTPYGYSLFEFQVFGTQAPAGCGATNAALGRPATASTVENATFGAGNAVDGNPGTRWSSAFSDPQWIQVDLGGVRAICQVQLSWEAAYASAYQIQTSTDGSTWTTVFATATGTGGTQTLTVAGTGRYVRMAGTARGTPYGYSLWEFGIRTGDAPPPTSPGTPPADGFWGDTSAIPAAQNVVMLKVLNRTNGRYPDSQVYWSFNGQVHSIAEQPYLDMPANSAGRMYFYLGTPNGPYFDFIEFTVGPGVFNGNTTRVDAFGLKLALRLHSHDGSDVQVGENQATFAEDRSVTFQRFSTAMPPEFRVLAQAQAPYRIISPGNDPSFRAGGVNQNYFTAYANANGISAPTSDIFGCAGVLANDADHCAALNRHVAQLPPAQWSTPGLYYQAAPANYYAKFWHDNAINGLAYGFPYDDVASQSSFVSHQNPQYLLVAVGW
jgi:F5/8 type C domain/Beta-1,3-glucanase